MRIKKVSSGRYQVRWRDPDGKQRAKNFRTKELAHDHCRRIDRGEDVKEGKVPTFATFANVWRERHGSVTKAERTMMVAWESVERYLVPTFGNVRLDRLTQVHLLDLRAKLVGTQVRGRKPMSPKTVNNILVLARQILLAAVAEGLITESPWGKVKNVKVPEQDFRYWTMDERERFLRFCRSRDPELAELVLVATHTGLRKGELKALQRQQLDFATGQIKVNATYDDHLGRRLERSKNAKVGFVKMSQDVREALLTKSIAPGETPVFRAELFSDLYDRLRRRCVEAGVKEIGPHGLRHTFASIMIMRGAPILAVSKFLRHSSITMTERYAHLAPTFMDDVIEMVSARNVNWRGGDKPKSNDIDKLVAIPAGLEDVKLLSKNSKKTAQ